MRAPVSVIIPCYRCAATIGRAVESVIGQTLPPEEILLVEDDSQDEGRTLASLYGLQTRLQDEIAIKVIPLPKNVGPGGARNTGWNEARQPYLAFLDADDSWHPKKIEIQYGWMASHPEATLTGHRSVIIATDGAPEFLPDELKVRQIAGRSLLISNCFPTRSVMLHRNIANRFDPTKRYAEDYLLWLQIVLTGQAAYFLDLPLAYSYKVDFGGGGLTGNLWKMERGELDTYRQLHLAGLITHIQYPWIVIFSLLKYMRRLLSLIGRRD